ncbi:hypothetical protein [Bradyrhizobium japonicum]|uniref:hypothetical protein n=1 Tax=Bradyrhizobium japonicum TaxID=375 RepID=UPI0004867653
MVMGASQRNALNKTALGTANALKNWSDMVTAEMKKQGVSRYPQSAPAAEGKPRWLSGRRTDGDELVSFPRRKIREMLDEMASAREELLRFEKIKP